MPSFVSPLRAALAAVIGWLIVAGSDSRAAETQPPTFERDVAAVLAKAGCNQGACHGNQNGKGGFKLSLRGQDRNFDRQSIVAGAYQRRINPVDPAESLLVLKAVAAVPHGGGRRVRLGSPEYCILVDWIATNPGLEPVAMPTLAQLSVEPGEQYLLAPVEQVQLRATATFADGTTRDVTRWAVYSAAPPTVDISPAGLVTSRQPGETTVLVRYLDQQVAARLAFVPARPGFVAAPAPTQHPIDQLVWAKLARLRITPAGVCSDSAFVRRVYFDLLGLPPTADEARAFVNDSAADKRARLADRLLQRLEFADYWALKWADLMRAEERALDRKGVQAFHHWLRQQIADGRPLDEFVRDLLTARGSTYQTPATNFYRAQRDPISRAESVGQVFLGVRLQCAKCHNHPFDRWTQDDYYRWASVFAGIDYKVLENRRRDRNDKHEFDGEQLVFHGGPERVVNPTTGARALPRLLGQTGDDTLAKDGPTMDARLERMASWLTSDDQRQFAVVQANRVWFHLLGRGIVEPIDDFRASNPASNPELLARLADEMIAVRYDLRALLRWIMQSTTYQLASATNATNLDDEANFSHALVRAWPAEPLLDALHQATGTPTRFDGYPRGLRATQLPGLRTERGASPGSEEEFLVRFGKPPRLLTCECERTTEPTLNQTFQLMSGPQLQRLLSDPKNRLAKQVRMLEKRADQADEAVVVQVVDELFWSTLSRPPTAEELRACVGHITAAAQPRSALEDVLWGLINAKEFLLRY